MPNLTQEKPDARLLRFDQSGALLRKVMDSAAIGMALVGIDGRVLYSNRAFADMLVCFNDDCLGMSAAELIHPADRDITMLHFGRLTRGEAETFQRECRLLRSDGQPLWVLAVGTLLKSDSTGEPLYSTLQFVNIDLQKKADEALVRSEGRLNIALEAAGQGVWDYDAQRDEIYHSPSWRTMRGFEPDEYIDPARDKWFERMHPDDVERVRSIVEKQEHGDEGFDAMEYRERHRDGHYIWILSRGRPVEWDSEGRRTRAVGTDTDITRLKTVEGQLAEEKERLRVTLESIGDGVISTDADEKIIFMNPVAEALTGWAEADAMGRLVSEVFNAKIESTGEAARDAVAGCLRAGKPVDIDDEIILASRDGNGRAVAGTAAPVRSEDGHTIGAVLVFKDITETMEQQRRLAHSANHDPLTGLPNRAAFVRALEEARRQSDIEQRDHALCFIDLDRFKPVNDTAGHAAGDALLQKVAQLIRRNTRIHDLSARMGGDEFVVLLADCSLAQASMVARKIVDAIAKLDFAWNGTTYRIGASIGLTMVTADAGRDPVAEADAACYAAKSAGRGRVSVYSPGRS